MKIDSTMPVDPTSPYAERRLERRARSKERTKSRERIRNRQEAAFGKDCCCFYEGAQLYITCCLHVVSR